MMRSKLSALLVACLAAVPVTQALAQDKYPSRPITLIAPYSAGGDSDLAARNFAAVAQSYLGQPVVVQNKPGASGIIGSQLVLQSPPDGYTLLLARTGSQAILPAVAPSNTKYKWDDFTFIGMLELNPYGCMVKANSPYTNAEQFLKGLKEKGKGMNFATAGVATTNDMGPRLLFDILKLGANSPQQIPFKGTGEATAALMAGQVDFACGSIGPFMQLIKHGDLRAMFITTPERIKDLPNVPTAREAGVQDMEKITGWSGIFAPSKMPPAMVEQLWKAVQEVGKDQKWRRATEQAGAIPYIIGPDETRKFIKNQFDVYESIGKSLNMIDKVL